jgi:hypothetical protein
LGLLGFVELVELVGSFEFLGFLEL